MKGAVSIPTSSAKVSESVTSLTSEVLNPSSILFVSTDILDKVDNGTLIFDPLNGCPELTEIYSPRLRPNQREQSGHPTAVGSPCFNGIGDSQEEHPWMGRIQRYRMGEEKEER